MPEETFIPVPTEPYVEVNRRPELSAKPIDKRPMIVGVVVALVVIILFGLLGWWLFTNPPAAAVLRDIFIIFLGLGAFLIILLLIALVVITIYLILKINDLVQLLNREIKPVLLQLQSTVSTAQGTAKFLSEQAVKPVITTASTVSATKAIFRSLFRRK
jgi:hypothetical protein